MLTNSGKIQCLLCDRLAGKIDPPGGLILENEYWLIEHAFTPVCLPGLLNAVLKRHCEDPVDLTPAEVASYRSAVAALTQAMKKVFPAKTFQVETLPDGLAHVHFSIFPQILALEPDPISTYIYLKHKAILVEQGETSGRPDGLQIDQVAARLRKELRKTMIKDPSQGN